MTDTFNIVTDDDRVAARGFTSAEAAQAWLGKYATILVGNLTIQGERMTTTTTAVPTELLTAIAHAYDQSWRANIMARHCAGGKGAKGSREFAQSQEIALLNAARALAQYLEGAA